MRKKLLILLTLFAVSIPSFSQRVLEMKEKTEALSVFIDKDPEIDNAGGAQAGAIISCPLTLNLNFSSNLDRTVDVFKTEERGELRFYYLRFIVGRFRGASYSNRVLEVTAQGFLPLKFSLDLGPSQSKSYEIFDPNATVGVGCFYENFNVASELYRNSNYAAAKEKFILSKECTDYQESSNVDYILESIDSIFVLRTRGDYFYNISDYNEALNAYQKVIGYNSSDEYALVRRNEMLNKINELCTNYFHEAEGYFYQGKFAEAQPLYEKVIELSCTKNNREANLRLLEIKNYLFDRKQRAKVFLYEFAENTPIGLSYGRYRQVNFSTYVSLRINPELFDALMKKDNKDAKPEVDLSFGWTRMVIKEVGFFAGIGYTGVGKWDYGINGENNDDPKLTLYHAVSPEAGVLFKIGAIAIRYTFQYRFALEQEYKDYIGTVNNVIGIGFCF